MVRETNISILQATTNTNTNTTSINMITGCTRLIWGHNTDTESRSEQCREVKSMARTTIRATGRGAVRVLCILRRF